jgi:ubiquinone/menaquinone biosynthesis C-methylase UbiE
MSADEEIAHYYGRGEEVLRLAEGPGRLELVRTQELLSRHLPDPPARILDVGGGPGVYASWLTGLGYEVHLLDPIDLHVEQALARRPRPASAAVGDARELPFADSSYDAVVLLGPLYHLQVREDRLRALVEARRVLRPGGLLAAAAISRFAPTVDGLAQGTFAVPGFEEIVERSQRDGRHINPDRHPRWFTTAYFHLPGDLEAEVREAGLELLGLLAVEGPGEAVPDVAAWLDDPERREILLRAIARVEAEPTMIGSSPHMLALAKSPG